MISLLVLMAGNVFMNHNDVMEELIVKIIQMNLFAPLHVQLTCLLVPMARNAFLSLKSVMDGLIVRMDLMKVYQPVPSFLSAQKTSLLVQMARNVSMNHSNVMGMIIVGMVQMNLKPFVLLHVQTVCMLVLMACNVYQR